MDAVGPTTHTGLSSASSFADPQSEATPATDYDASTATTTAAKVYDPSSERQRVGKAESQRTAEPPR